MTMTRTYRASGLFVLLFLVLSSYGCTTHNVRHTLSPAYGKAAPVSIVALPAAWKVAPAAASDEEKRVGRIISDLVVERLKSRNYTMAAIDDASVKAGEGLKGAVDARKYAEIARAHKVDAIVATVITDWKKSSSVAGYVSLKFESDFIMVAANGELLWSAHSEAKESDLPVPLSVRSDREAVEISVLKAYEAKLQRYVDAVFSTLPPMTTAAQRKTYFDWLP